MSTIGSVIIREAFGGLPGRAGLQSDPYPTRRSNVVIGLGFGIAALVAIRLLGASESIWGLVTSAIIVITCCLGVVMTLVYPRAFTPGGVRAEIDRARGHISFRSRAVLIGEWVAFALMMLWSGAAVVLVLVEYEVEGNAFSLGRLPRSVFIVLGLGMFSLGHMVRKIRQESEMKSGLNLTPEYITAAGDGTVHRIAWRDLYRVTIDKRFVGGLHLVLLDDDRNSLGAVSVRYLGSDPMVVAAFLHYFRDHPEERALLGEPERALEQFEQHLSHLAAQGAPSEPSG